MKPGSSFSSLPCRRDASLADQPKSEHSEEHRSKPVMKDNIQRRRNLIKVLSRQAVIC